jgi:hypothetical protein
MGGALVTPPLPSGMQMTDVYRSEKGCLFRQALGFKKFRGFFISGQELR